MSHTRTMRREKDSAWAELEVKLEEGRLSLTMASGRVLSRAAAEAEALASWVDYFYEKDVRDEMALRARRFFETPEEAAAYVVAQDGALHGLDVHSEEGGRVYVLDALGRAREDVALWFPEAVPHLDWHLNDMHAGCVHQDKLSWGRDRDVALDRSSATTIQLAVLDALLEERNVQRQEKEFAKRMAELHSDARYRHELLEQVLKRRPSNYEVEAFGTGRRYVPGLQLSVEAYLHKLVSDAYPAEPFKAEIFKASIGAPCPECGTRYGVAWYKRELPAETVTWATSFGMPVATEETKET